MQGDGLLGKEIKANEIFLSSPSPCNDALSSIIILLGQCEERSAAQDDSWDILGWGCSQHVMKCCHAQ